MNIITEIAIGENEDTHKWANYEDVINEDFFLTIANKVIDYHPQFPKNFTFELSVLLTNNEQIASLNNEFRGKNKPTNVLSFPDYEEKLYQLVDFSKMDNYMYLGDIAFGFDQIKQEAEEAVIEFIDHFTHLTIHAILHLIGYDHIKDEEAELMENIEVKLLESLNIKSPY